MRRIYSQAEVVISWLGQEENDSDLAMAFISRWYDGIILATNHVPEFWLNSLKATLPFVKDPFDKQSVRATGFLLRRAYWRRLWIVPEVGLASRGLILCGALSINHVQLYSTTIVWAGLQTRSLDDQQLHNEAILSADELFDPLVNNLMVFAVRSQRSRPDDNPVFRNALSVIRMGLYRSCTDPRDRLYAFFGLIDKEQLPMQPDYQLTFDEIRMTFTTGLIRTSKQSDVIALAGFGSHRREPEEFPTWVPKYSVEMASSYYLTSDMISLSWHAAADTNAEGAPQNSNLLQTRGVICGEVIDKANKARTLFETDMRHGKQAWIWDWLALAKPSPETKDIFQDTRVPWRQAFFRTITADIAREAHVQSRARGSYNESLEGFMCFMRSQALLVAISYPKNEAARSRIAYLSLESLLLTDMLDLIDTTRLVEEHGEEVAYWLANSSTTKNECMRIRLLDLCLGEGKSDEWPFKEYGCKMPSPNVAIFKRSIDAMATARSFFVMQNGYMGLAPWYRKKGDLICILLGCSVPIILRKWGSNYVVVGDAYVYGMMQGEIMEEVEKERLHVQDLILQ